jgi:putative ABC transport system substrate-binding protein
MKRRDFIALLGGAAVGLPFVARAQQGAMPVIGFLNAGSAQGYARLSAAFVKGMGEAGYVLGRNVAIEYRWAEGRNDQLATLAADLVQRRVAMIAATSTPAALAAKAATSTIPIVFEMAADPVQLGLVASLNRPGSNMTGVTQINLEVGPKRLELLHELLPDARTMALLVNPANPAVVEAAVTQMRAAAHTLGLELHVLNASTETDLEAAFADLPRLRARGLIISARRSVFRRPARTARRAGGTARSADGHRKPPVCGGRRIGQLRRRHRGCLPPRRCVRRPRPQRREARGSAGPAGKQDRVVHQHQGREGAGNHIPAIGAGPRGRGDRVKRREFITLIGGTD